MKVVRLVSSFGVAVTTLGQPGVVAQRLRTTPAHHPTTTTDAALEVQQDLVHNTASFYAADREWARHYVDNIFASGMSLPQQQPEQQQQQPNSPITTCQTRPRRQVFLELLMNYTAADELLDPTTPQGRAYAWLTTTTNQVDPCTYSTVAQRYGLATLFYAMGGADWTRAAGWLSGLDECVWQHVECDTESAHVVALELSTCGGCVYVCVRERETLGSVKGFPRSLVRLLFGTLHIYTCYTYI
jgi:hypothetical protein